MGSEAFASARRIQTFLDNVDGASSESDFVVDTKDDTKSNYKDVADLDQVGLELSQQNKSESMGESAIDKGLLLRLCGNFSYEYPPMHPNTISTAVATADKAESKATEDNSLHEAPSHTVSTCGPESLVTLDGLDQAQKDEAFLLKDVHVEVRRGELVLVVGPVGAGKSSLLSAVLGNLIARESTDTYTSLECQKMNNEVNNMSTNQSYTCESVAYAAQTPWIFAGTVQANITLAGQAGAFGSDQAPGEPDYTLYTHAVESCRLVEDMKVWPLYDKTQIGERGLSISGGQKARVALSRAVYSDRSLLLLDDPLSAVDAHVSRALFFDCILPLVQANAPYSTDQTWKPKGVLMATHQLQYIPHATKVVVIDADNKQRFFGTSEELMRRKDDFPFLDIPNENEGQSRDSGLKKVLSGILPAANYDRSAVAYAQERQKSDAVTVKKQDQEGTIIQKEDQVEGKLTGGIWWRYFSQGGVFNLFATILLLIAAQGLSIMSDYWIRWWADEQFWDQRDSRYVLVFAGIVVACVFMGFGRARYFFHFCLRASSAQHGMALRAVFHAPLTFFNANPAGRILNRFAKDTGQVDELFPVILYDCAQNLLLCFSAFVLVAVSLPWATIVMPFIFAYMLKMRHAYVENSRELKRIEAVTRSPVYADFSAVLEGIQTLRAYKLEVLMRRGFLRRLHQNARSWFSFLMLNRWLGFRLDSTCTIMVCLTVFLATALRSNGSVDVGLIGFAFIYIMQVTALFQYAVRQSAEVEDAMTAVERIMTYSALKPELGYLSSCVKPPNTKNSSIRGDRERKGSKEWKYLSIRSSSTNNSTLNRDSLDSNSTTNSGKGHLELCHLEARYRSDMEARLINASLDIKAGNKVGICGRTGSGKSTLLLALLRLNVVSNGSMVLDGDSLLEMDLQNSRRRFALIPQEASFFSGTVRFNMDPLQIYTDEEIWTALEDAHIKDYMISHPDRLEAAVGENGGNFSAGQRQLLSLARAILHRNASVVLCDEVTASVDYQTDALVNDTLRNSERFKNATIITIAHRLRTIADVNTIVVMDKGNIVEVDDPAVLLADESSRFYNLCEQSGELDDIKRICNDRVSNRHERESERVLA